MKINQEFLPENYYNDRVDKVSGQPIPVDMLVIHCSAYPKDQMIQVLKEQGLSAHYLIETDGSITQLVDEEKRAWHAGAGSWYGIQNINAHSVGIELVNPSLGHMIPYPEKQIESFMSLAQDIISRYHIKAHHVLAHSDMAPTRKFDPGRLFPWDKLAQNGIGLYPEKEMGEKSQKSTRELLQMIGYPVDNEKASLRSFVRHFVPELISDQESADHDYFDFLWHYEDYLPEVLKNQKFPMKRVNERLNLVAQTYQKSRGRD